LKSKLLPISSICDIVLSGTPKTSTPEYWNGDIKWITVKDIVNKSGRFIENTEKAITKLGINNSAAKILPKNTVIISARGTVGKLCLIPTEMSCNQSCYGLISNLEIIRPLFLYYSLENSSYDNFVYGSVFDTITRKTFNELKILVPSLELQDKIIDQLGNLDNQIELLKKQNQILEKIIQLIFKSWFLNYELDEIPKDWIVSKLNEHTIIKGRIGWKGLKSSEYSDIGYHLVTGNNIINNLVDWDSCPRVSEDRYSESPDIMLKQNDILMTKDGTIGRLAFVDKLESPASVGTGIFVIRPNSKLIDEYFLLALFKSSIFKGLVGGRIEGSVIPHLYQRDINDIEIVIPEKSVSEKFSKITKKIIEIQYLNFHKIEYLTKIHHQILPKLISGEIQV